MFVLLVSSCPLHIGDGTITSGVCTMKEQYEPPALTMHGSVVSLTMGMFGSDVDGSSGMVGNQSNSDNTGGGSNAGMVPMA